MPLMFAALYEALLSAGADEGKARQAAEEAAAVEARFTAIGQGLAGLETRLGRIEERLGQTPTKGDVAELKATVAETKTDLTRYILIGSGLISTTVSAAILVAKFFVP